jgi:hypothetical protein
VRFFVKIVIRVGVALTLAVAVFLLGRASVSPEAQISAPTSPVLASWDGGVLVAADLEGFLSEYGPQGRARYREEKARRELVGELAHTALFASEAVAAGLDKTPSIQRQRREQLAAQFVKVSFDQKRGEPSEADARAWYDAHPQEFSQEDAIRTAQIVLAAPPSDAALRERRRKEAQALLAELLKAKDFYAFNNAAHAKSDDVATRGSGGELPAMTPQQLQERFGGSAASALFQTQAGAIANTVFETDAGFVLLRVLDRRQAAIAPYESVREAILNRLRAAKKTEAWNQFLKELEAQRGFSINEDAVRAFVVK